MVDTYMTETDYSPEFPNLGVRTPVEVKEIDEGSELFTPIVPKRALGMIILKQGQNVLTGDYFFSPEKRALVRT